MLYLAFLFSLWISTPTIIQLLFDECAQECHRPGLATEGRRGTIVFKKHDSQIYISSMNKGVALYPRGFSEAAGGG